MRFGVLGRLEVFLADGAPVTITGPARRQVLAALLARSGSLVSAATLVEDLWGPSPPRSAIGNLRSHVARLRDNLGRTEVVLTTEGDGYRLRIGPADLDSARFEAMVAEAAQLSDPVSAISRYDAALALWRDEAYVEFGDAPFAVAERVRLAELRARARERRTELALKIGQAGELVGELEQRVRLQPYRERGWEQLALALYRDGRQADALQACRRARAVLVEDLGVDPGPGLRDVESRILRQDPELLVVALPQRSVSDGLQGRCPYLGLAGYTEHDAPIFVGRERLTSVLAGHLADHSVVVLTGASGVGKSSLVRAGLVPALRAGAVPGSAAWRVAVRTPTDQDVVEDTARRPDLLVLDQGEELFTGLDPSAHEKLVAELANYVSYGDGRLLIVLRSDYYGRLADVPRLAGFAERATVLVGPMRADELHRALVEPAAAAGVSLEPDLIETIMSDVADQPEPLPLLSEAMVRTWAARSGDRLTLEGYRLAGGVAGALEAAAEECFTHLHADARAAARRLLVRMAAPANAGGWVRRPLGTGGIAESGPDRDALDALARARLIVVGDDRVDIAHDALLEHWPRLREWLDERATAADMLDHLARTASAWRESGHSPADLYRGARLAAALEWRTEHPGDLAADEQKFLDASEHAAEAELAVAREQLEREIRGRRRIRRVAVALAAVVVLAVTAGVVALHERGTAQRQARRAAGEALTADVSRLATLAPALPSDQRSLALLLAAEGDRLQPSDVSAGGLQTVLMQTPPGLDRVMQYRSPSVMPHLDRTGRLLAAAGADGSVTVYDVASGAVVRTITGSTPRQFAVLSGDDRLVAAGSSDGEVTVWDVSTGRQSGVPLPVGDGTVHAVFDPRDNNRIYAVSGHGAVSAWDRSEPEHPRLVSRFTGLSFPVSPGQAPDLSISADGTAIAAGPASGGDACIWDTRTGRTVRAFTGVAIGNFAATGDSLAFGYGADTVLVDARTGRTETTVLGTGGSGRATLSADGKRLAVPQVTGGTDAIAIYDTATHKQVGAPLLVYGISTFPLAFLADGRLAVTDAAQAGIWTLGKTLPPLGLRIDTTPANDGTGSVSEAPQFLPGFSDIVLNGSMRYSGATGEPKGALIDRGITAVDASPDGRFVVSAGLDGIAIWDAANRVRVSSLLSLPPSAEHTVDVSWSTDGKLIMAVVGGSMPYLWQVSDPRHPPQPRRVGASAPGVVDSAAISPDSKRLVIVSAGGSRISAVDIASGKVVWTRAIEQQLLRQWALAPDGSTIALDSGGPTGGRVSVLDAATGTPRVSAALPSWGGIGYVDGGHWLVISSDQPDPQARLYDVSTLQPFGTTFPTGDVDQHPLATDRPGQRFAEQIADDVSEPLFDTPLVWTVDPAAWTRLACTIAGRNLTAAEWRQYLPDRPYRATCPGWPPGT